MRVKVWELDQRLNTFCESQTGEQAGEGSSEWVRLPSPSLPVKPPAAQDSSRRTPPSSAALQRASSV